MRPSPAHRALSRGIPCASARDKAKEKQAAAEKKGTAKKAKEAAEEGAVQRRPRQFERDDGLIINEHAIGKGRRPEMHERVRDERPTTFSRV